VVLGELLADADAYRDRDGEHYHQDRQLAQPAEAGALRGCVG
jgi:hypothetical protein